MEKKSVASLELFRKNQESILKQAKKMDSKYQIFGASKHRYQLNPVVSLEKVRAFEQKYQIILPEEYVFFLTQVGNCGRA